MNSLKLKDSETDGIVISSSRYFSSPLRRVSISLGELKGEKDFPGRGGKVCVSTEYRLNFVLDLEDLK